MSRADPDLNLDDVIADILIDAYDHDEGLIDINADQYASRLLAAYRRWTGAENPTT